jgi:hypothetical protein
LLIGLTIPGGFNAGSPPIHHGWLIFPGMVLLLVATVSWSIAWMRLVLGVPETEVRLRFGRREWKYAGLFYGSLIAASVILFVLEIVLVFVLGRTGFLKFSSPNARHLRLSSWLLLLTPLAILMLTFIALWYRVIVVLPAIALDQYKGLRAHWRQTRNNFWRIVVILIATTSPGWVACWPLKKIPRDGGLVGDALMAALWGVIALLVSAFSHTALALVYRRLVQENGSSAMTPTQQ